MPRYYDDFLTPTRKIPGNLALELAIFKRIPKTAHANALHFHPQRWPGATTRRTSMAALPGGFKSPDVSARSRLGIPLRLATLHSEASTDESAAPPEVGTPCNLMRAPPASKSVKGR